MKCTQILTCPFGSTFVHLSFPAVLHNGKPRKGSSPTSADSTSPRHPALQYDSGINTDTSGYSSVSHRDLHNASCSDASDLNSPSPAVSMFRDPNTGKPCLINLNPSLPRAKKTNPTLNTLAIEFDPLLGTSRAAGTGDPLPNASQVDPLRTVGGRPKLVHSPVLRGGLLPENRGSASYLPSLEVESPSIVRPRPRPRGDSMVDVIPFRSPDGPFAPKSPTRSTCSIQSLVTYPTFDNTFIPYLYDDGSSISSLSLADQTTSDVEDNYNCDSVSPTVAPGAFCWSLDIGAPM